MRRLQILVSVLVLVDTMLYAALVPLLPHFARQLHLSKAGAGTLVAAASRVRTDCVPAEP